MNKVRMCGEVWIQGRSLMKRGGGRPVAFLSKVSLRTELPKISLRLPDLRCPRDVEPRRVSCGIQGR